ncbi:uncharacterized protein EDB93DRAFT_1170811 [Suillus bovinus]|uniref:uncharacterized protein n=1 Tax=Suillus bovinus TaxID=48563 RepID=UPI001B86D06E|nr:uncharacterized protein EDB93DRAFT_1170811 [Suillus bovinus]KAG2135352.1 hypothetical protein EDB93DRAFT_1170811 [Suillus bovinus]
MTKYKRPTSQTPVKSIVPKFRKKKVTPTGNVKRPRVMIPWSKPENHHLTDQLLTLIEDSELWKADFGFDKGTSGSVVATGKGKNTLKHSAGAQFERVWFSYANRRATIIGMSRAEKFTSRSR